VNHVYHNRIMQVAALYLCPVLTPLIRGTHACHSFGLPYACGRQLRLGGDL
jgi:hypothetical protein